eukprot:TRINITY_DN4983_c0_g1_i4.p1 TRINITY_DN4983_c0_g1~~TRINITY_DN4983_c0_g1_i4.p1  ORF type:complete len:155 (-),score=23.63 TRINITY_DN4983_c0_g1_i4:297-761(-)
MKRNHVNHEKKVFLISLVLRQKKLEMDTSQSKEEVGFLKMYWVTRSRKSGKSKSNPKCQENPHSRTVHNYPKKLKARSILILGVRKNLFYDRFLGQKNDAGNAYLDIFTRLFQLGRIRMTKRTNHQKFVLQLSFSSFFFRGGLLGQVEGYLYCV